MNKKVINRIFENFFIDINIFKIAKILKIDKTNKNNNNINIF